jgi:argininosuccinate synthase
MKELDKSKIKKVVLAYSGGLDTSVIIPWLKENYNNCEIIAVSGNVGQADELEGLEEKALATGASKLYVLDLTNEYVDEYIIPTMKAGAIYEDYLLGTSTARPCIAKGLVEIALKEGADAICHGCTGKGNDQVRFELSIKHFAPEMPIIPLARVGAQIPRGRDRLRRGAQYPAEDQPRDQLFQGQEPVAPVP